MLTAYAVAQTLPDSHRTIVYANTKTWAEPDIERLSPHIGRLPSCEKPHTGARIAGGSTAIDRTVPRGPEGCPLILILPPPTEEASLTGEIAALDFDQVIGVDTGGDVLDRRHSRPPGRDRRMLAVLAALKRPLRVLVVAPGADGQSTVSRLSGCMQAADVAFRGSAPLTPLLAIFQTFAPSLSPHRTPRLILEATEAATRGDLFFPIPRGNRPTVPISWMTSMLIYDGALL